MNSEGNNLLENLEKRLKQEYNEIDIEKLLNLIYRLSLIVCTERNKEEKKRLEAERKSDEEKLDKIINNNELLMEEFDKRNEKLTKYKKIFSPDVLLATIKKERKQALNEIEEANKLLDARNYVKEVTRLEKDLELLQEIKNTNNKENYKIEIQKLFIKYLENSIYKVDTIEHKKHIILLFHILRYYNFILFDENRFIKDVEELQEPIESLEEKIILKLYDFKMLNPITKDIETDIGIIKPILRTRILDFANIIIQPIKQENNILIKIYDGNIEELEYSIENLNNVDFKNKKKIKLFAK